LEVADQTPKIQETYYRVDDPKYPTFIIIDKFDGDLNIEQQNCEKMNILKLNYASIPKIIDRLKKIYKKYSI